jgi:hypothetical protein
MENGKPSKGNNAHCVKKSSMCKKSFKTVRKMMRGKRPISMKDVHNGHPKQPSNFQDVPEPMPDLDLEQEQKLEPELNLEPVPQLGYNQMNDVPDWARNLGRRKSKILSKSACKIRNGKWIAPHKSKSVKGKMTRVRGSCRNARN